MGAPTNHALTATVTASSNWPTYVASRVKDGLFGVGWLAASGSVTNQTLDFAFVGAVTFDTLEFVFQQEAANALPQNYEIYVSDDGVAWGVAVKSGAFANTNWSVQFVTLPAPQTKAYCRVKFLDNFGHATYMGEVMEVRIYSAKTELIAGASYTSSNGISAAIGNIRDNLTSTSAYATADGIPWRFDLGSAKWIDNLLFFSWETANYQPHEVQMWVSSDGLIWKAVGTAQACTYGSSKAIIVLSFPKVYSRYVGFSAMRSTGIQGFIAYEMRVYDQAAPTAFSAITGLTPGRGNLTAAWTAFEAASAKAFRVYIRAGSAPDSFGTSSPYFLEEVENDIASVVIRTLADKSTLLVPGTQYYVIVRVVYNDDTEDTNTTALNDTPDPELDGAVVVNIN